MEKLTETQIKWERTLKTNALSIRYMGGLGEEIYWEGRILNSPNRESITSTHSETVI